MNDLRSPERWPPSCHGTAEEPRTWLRLVGLLVGPIAASVLGLWGTCRAASEPAAGDTAAPLVIPHPQLLQVLGPEAVVVGRDGKNVTRVVGADGHPLLVEAERLWTSELERLGFAPRWPAGAERGSKPTRDRTTPAVPGEKPVACTLHVLVAATPGAEDRLEPALQAAGVPPLSTAESRILAKSDQAYVLRVRPGNSAAIEILGASPLGVYYGMTTLVQLVRPADSTSSSPCVLRSCAHFSSPHTPCARLAHGDIMIGTRPGVRTPLSLTLSPDYRGEGTFGVCRSLGLRPGRSAAVVPQVSVHDYPDIPQRMAADWVLKWDWEVNGYDWGDGLDAFVARVKRKIDLCSRFKINQVRFLGGRIAPGTPGGDERYRLTQKFARDVNRYARQKGVALQYSAVSWGTDYYDWGRPYPQPWILNRRSYPDGEVYACFGGTVGSCLSNDALSREIAARYKPLVRDWEPGSLYLHHIDVAKYAESKATWSRRCPDCRRQFPDDEPASPHGMAVAVARLYNTLIAELKSVRCPASDYDPARDLEIVLASPGYSYADESDAEWDKQLVFWREIARQVKDKQNVRLTFREQYKRLDNRALRIEQLSQTLAEAGWPDALFVFASQGADFLMSGHMLVSSPVLTAAYRRSGVLYAFNGHAFSEVQVLANVNYAWNHRAPGAVDPAPLAGAALAAEAQRYGTGAARSEYLYGPFLETACARLYGAEAAPWMAKLFRLERDRGPLCPTILWLERLATNGAYDWQGQAARNGAAKELVDQAVAVCDPRAKEDLTRLSQCLDVGAEFCRLLHTAHHAGPDEEAWRRSVKAGADALPARLEKEFRFERSEPDGGDPGCWLELAARIGRLELKQAPSEPPLRETVKHEQGAVTVEVSSVLPGYRAASVLASDPAGKGWGQDGGWNDATPKQFPDTLAISFKEPRRLQRVDVYTLADGWRDLARVDEDLEFRQYGITDLDVEVRPPDGPWRVVRSVRENRKVLIRIPLDGAPVAAIRLRVLGSADGQFSRVVHVDSQ